MSREELKHQKVDGKLESGVWNFISNIVGLVHSIMLLLLPFVITLGILVVGLMGGIYSLVDTYEYTGSGLVYATEFGYDGEVKGIDDYLRGDVYSKYVSKELTPKQMELYEGFLQLTEKKTSNIGYKTLYRHSSGSFMGGLLKLCILIISTFLIAVSPFVGVALIKHYW